MGSTRAPPVPTTHTRTQHRYQHPFLTPVPSTRAHTQHSLPTLVPVPVQDFTNTRTQQRYLDPTPVPNIRTRARTQYMHALSQQPYPHQGVRASSPVVHVADTIIERHGVIAFETCSSVSSFSPGPWHECTSLKVL